MGGAFDATVSRGFALKRIFALACVLNSPAIAMALVYCVYVIWFAKYQQRNVGPSVTYAAYALLAFALSQLSNLTLWIGWRKRPEVRQFLRRFAVCVFAFTFACFWIGDRFRYVGERYALTHSLWSAIRMKDPPLFMPTEAAGPEKSHPQQPAAAASRCLEGCN
jgi:hypothetical protein